MGWELSTKKEGDVTKYRIWSNMVDEWITKKWLTREEIIKFLFWHRFREFTDAFMKDAITFPHGWIDKNCDTYNSLMNFPDLRNEFYKFQTESNEDESQEIYYKKLTELLTKHGVIVKVSDDAGFGYNSNDN